MFYICGLYDTVLTAQGLNLYANNVCRCYANGTVIECTIDRLHTIKVGVFDSTDYSIEWYLVPDLLNIIAKTGVEILGVELLYYADFKKKGLASPNNLDSLKSLNFHVSIAECNSEYMKTIAKMRMSGIDVSIDGTLNIVSKQFIKNDTIVIPKYIKRFGPRVSVNSDLFKDIKYLKVSNDFDFNSYCAYDVRNFIKRNLSKDAVLVIDGDFKVSNNLLKSLACNIKVLGTVYTGDFKNFVARVMNPKTYDLARFTDKVLEVSDNTKVYTLDFVHGEYRVTKY